MEKTRLALAVAAPELDRFSDGVFFVDLSVQRDRYPLTLNDCVVVSGALSALEGDLERASRLLTCAVASGAVRPQAMFAIYRHYRAIVLAGLDRDTIRRCREEGRALDLVEVLDEELARRLA